MGAIYSQAATVFAWIGEADEASDLVFDVLREFSRRRSQNFSPPGFDAAERLDFDRDMFCELYFEIAGRLPVASTDDDQMLHEEINWLQHLYGRKYCGRACIVQEAILAKGLWVCCGNKDIELEHIYGLSLDWGSFEQGFGTGNHQQQRPTSKGWLTIQAICGHRRRRDKASHPESISLGPEQYVTLHGRSWRYMFKNTIAPL